MTDQATRIELRSDNAAGAADELLEAIARANTGGALAYGGDPWTARMESAIGEVFEHRVRVFPVGSGTAANGLGLSSLLRPWQGRSATPPPTSSPTRTARRPCLGGAQLLPIPGGLSKLAPDALAAYLDATPWGDPHNPQPAVVSVTQPTDYGELYTPAHLGELHEIGQRHGLRLHLDGARLANAVAALGCTPAEATWKAGVEVMSFGAIKNGGLSTDAVVCFSDEPAAELEFRTKRSGHTASKMRFQSAQLEAYVTDGRWLRWAGHANAMMQRLAEGLRDLGCDASTSPRSTSSSSRSATTWPTPCGRPASTSTPSVPGCIAS
ncbi:MAG: beta-eliminating lyase-related protein [Ilumatobacteraceae bacterium]